MRIAKSQQGDWTVSADLGDKGVTSKAVLSWHDKQSLFTMKTATKEQLAARYLNTEIKSMAAEKQTQICHESLILAIRRQTETIQENTNISLTLTTQHDYEQ